MGLMLFRHLSLLPRLLLRLLGHVQTHDHWARVTCHGLMNGVSLDDS